MITYCKPRHARCHGSLLGNVKVVGCSCG
uniref:Uncharacterized protein n=1 Tax=Arundo donax TaxID=35708 RepID=A0A0A9ARQ1_ARUDO